MSEEFLGVWLVSEYVYNPNGRFAGIIKQRRVLEKLANGRLRLSQHCMPSESLYGHPLAQFSGTPVFEMSIDGRLRRYHGPAVVGSGLSWGEGALTGRGVWPQFGHNFHSFAVLPGNEIQLTGGKFFNATQMIANIAGVAIPEEGAVDYPELNRVYAAETAVWQGSVTTFLAKGTLIGKKPHRRVYLACRQSHIHWHDESADWDLQEDGDRYHAVSKQLQGIAKRYGPLLEIEAVNKKGLLLEHLELLDTAHNHLIGIRRWYQDDELEKVEILRLAPQQD